MGGGGISWVYGEFPKLGPILVPLDIRSRNRTHKQKGPRILRTTHIKLVLNIYKRGRPYSG